MSSENSKKFIDINTNTRNFIAENVSNIQKLQDHVKSVSKQKSEMELKRSFRRRISQKMGYTRSKSCPRYNRIKKTKGQDKKVLERGLNRPRSPELEQNEEPQTFIETFKEISLEDKSRARNNISTNVNPPKVRSVSVRDFGCQYGDPKRTYFFEDGSNINVYVPSKEKTSMSLEKEVDLSRRIPFVVPSRYLLFKKKTYDEDIARQIYNARNPKKGRNNYRQRENREREYGRPESRDYRQRQYTMNQS